MYHESVIVQHTAIPILTLDLNFNATIPVQICLLLVHLVQDLNASLYLLHLLLLGRPHIAVALVYAVENPRHPLCLLSDRSIISTACPKRRPHHLHLHLLLRQPAL